jgi:hypothetical protein
VSAETILYCDYGACVVDPDSQPCAGHKPCAGCDNHPLHCVCGARRERLQKRLEELKKGGW